jgi:hypothetical protein
MMNEVPIIQYMKPFTTPIYARIFVLLLCFLSFQQVSHSQVLGVYDFNGIIGLCPNNNNAVSSQPANATFSGYVNTGGTCVVSTSAFVNKSWNAPGYNSFTITAAQGYAVTLSSLSFKHVIDRPSTGWELRSSLDNYSSVVASGPVSEVMQTSVVDLSGGNFNNLNSVTFRFTVLVSQGSTEWSQDDVTLNGTVVTLPANPPNPTSNSPQCSDAGVTLVATGVPPVGETWFWQTSATGRSTTNSGSTYNVTSSGTYYIRSRNNTTLAWSSGAGSASVVITPDVAVPTFAAGASSSRCKAAGVVSYTATANNSSSISYSLDAASIAGGNTINSATGAVTFDGNWVGTTVITAVATGCAGPKSATHTVTTSDVVTTPVFASGNSSSRCQGAGSVTYSASANHTTGITYALDATTAAFAGNSINASTGEVTFAAGWSGTTVITATAAGCPSNKSATHTVTVIATVGTPVFSAGSSSIRCIGAGTVTYSATATTTTGITYTLDAASLAANNTIDASTGAVTFDGAWSGTTVITATAAGCNGPKSATHTVTIRNNVTTPIFTLGGSSERCQGANSVTYTATANNSTGISYSLDAASVAAGNTINSSTGAVTYTSGWTGTSTITVTAAGCAGPLSNTHVVTTIPTVSTPVFASGTNSTRCQGAGTVNYTATSANSTGISYSLNSASITAGNTIDAATGDVTFVASYSGTTIITASAAGCNGPRTSTHTVTVTATVGTPVFASGASSARCQAAGTVTYSATATTSTSIVYSLDAASISGGNSINSATGAVTYVSTWSGTTIITATASGCNGPTTASHTVTVTPVVTTPVFSLGFTSERCQGAGSVTYTATASNTTGITYSLDATSINAGNTINSTTGQVNYVAGWSGTTVITAAAAGCSPQSSTHTVTVIPTVGSPVFSMGSTSSRCIAAGTVTYTATATTSTGMTYSLDAASLAGNNTINTATGAVTFDAAWSGTSVITATATGCNGPRSSTHTVTTNLPVGVPTFTAGANSVRCQTNPDKANEFVYLTATAAHASNLVYSLDATTDAFSGNSINASTGRVKFDDEWSGTSMITVTAHGCYGPQTATHTIVTIPYVGTPVFTAGSSSSRCQGAGSVIYSASATNTTGITYSLNSTSASAGNTIDSTTGQVTYVAGYSGTTVITASAAGCNGPKTSTHTVTVIATVGTPVFSSGSSSVRCQAAGTVTYSATATTSTGIVYSLDSASISGGNTINSSTGAVTYLSSWSGTSVITATASGCNGPSTSSHTVTITPVVTVPIFSLGSTSARCQGAGTVTYTATANNTTGISYSLDATSRNAGNTIVASTGAVTYVAGWTGTSVITATAAGCSPQSSTHTVTTIPTVGAPLFTSGATSSRCRAAGTVTYTATATNTTGITYSLDSASLAGNNTIDAATGAVTYDAGWSGTTVITATAAGCNGPRTATHTVTVRNLVTTPVFSLGATSVRCQGAGTVTYTATANHTFGITYSLDNNSIGAGNSINSSTGVVTYASGWSGTSTITASAAGCSGPQTATHVVTITPTVGTPVFAAGSSSTRCQGAESVLYSATATNTTGITYSLSSTSASAGNTINASTGEVTYVAGYSGTTVITASAAGCNGPRTSTHTVTVVATVGTPVFASGSTSTRCQAAGTVTYSATATTSTGIVYSLDSASISGGNTINGSTGAVTYLNSWSGTSVITATASGCNGPSTSTHTVAVTPVVTAPAFDLGSTSVRCQGAGTVTYTATANNTTGITYSLDVTSRNAGNTINTSTGAVTYVSSWSGTSVITATAAGCSPQSSTHTVTTTPTVGTPVFASGSTSVRCQAAGTVTYAATASSTSGITYALDATAANFPGNSINTATGEVTFDAAWSGTTTITATAAGCNGPKTATHTVTINQLVTTPVFGLGNSSVRCQRQETLSYIATASNATSITYSLDAATTSFAGNSINSTTGAVTFAAGWTGTTTITAIAQGCSGPKSATHTVTITPYVGTPVFASGSSSVRCQGAVVITYTATASNSSSIRYSLDSSSRAGGNTIDSLTGQVTFSQSWSGTSVITAKAYGCSGPKTASHSVSITPSVGTPVFLLGAMSTRNQSADTILYTATASHSTGIVYSLDNTSLANGNSINSTTGSVIFSAGWSGITTITATASGCSGPVTATHIVVINPSVVTTPLYFSEPGMSLDRIDPVATNDISTASTTAIRGTSSTPSRTFTQTQPICAPLTIKAKPLSVYSYITVTNNTVSTYPNIVATLKYDTTTIVTLTNPVYNSSTGLVTWVATPASEVTVPAGSVISLKVQNYDDNGFSIQYDSRTKPSRIELPVSSYINIESLDVYDAPYPGGAIRTNTAPGNNNYVRAVVSNPFGANDITGLNISILPSGGSGPATPVDSIGCTKTYEYLWTSSSVPGNYSISASSLQGYENKVTFVENVGVYVCTSCPPVANDDRGVGAGGSPVLLDVLSNDYDPNNNLDPSSLFVYQLPSNGDAIVNNGEIIYIPNGTFAGSDTFYYRICDLSTPTGLCDSAMVVVTIDPTIVDPCTDATRAHTFYIPYPEQDVRTALLASQSAGITIDSVRTIISIKVPYPGMTLVWDHWEDGYEVNALNPTQATTKVWGDGDPYNGIAPGYPEDVIPSAGSIVLDNTMFANPRNGLDFYYDGRDKLFASGQVSVSQVCGSPAYMSVQCMKTEVASTNDFGQSFTVPVGQDFPSQDFRYTALFVRASENNTVVTIDKDNNGSFETSALLDEGQSLLVNGGVMSGAKVTSNSRVGVDVHFGGVDGFSSRDIPLYPASWYSNTYYTPVPTTGSTTTIKDTNAVYLYNNLNRPININWSSGIPSSGTINLPPKTVYRFPLAVSQTAAYKFVNPTGESFTAIQVCDSYTPGSGGNIGSTYDWAFNLIAEARLTTLATTAWAPGSTDGTRNDNPIWVTPSANTTIYVKYDGDLTKGGLVSPNGLRYDVSYQLNALRHRRLLDPSDNNQSGLVVYTVDGTKLAAVYGEDPSTAVAGNPSWDVGSTIRPYCGLKLIFANDDYAFTLTDNPVTVAVLNNDFGFASEINTGSISNIGLLQPKHGTVRINETGSILYTPDAGYQGMDTLEYSVCSTPSPVVCDKATVYIRVTSCPTPQGRNLIAGQVFLDHNQDGLNNDGGHGFSPATVHLYMDGNCNGVVDPFELEDTVVVDSSGMYQFINYPEKTVADDFDGNTPGSRSCANGTNGNSPWAGNWTDSGDPSTGFCVTPSQTIGNTDAEIVKDGAFSFALRLKDNNVAAARAVNLAGVTHAFASFSYRRASTTLAAGEQVLFQASPNGTTWTTLFAINGDGFKDSIYHRVYNQDLSPYVGANTQIRFLTNNSVDEADSVYIDSIVIKFLKYPECYISKLTASSVPQFHYMTTPSSRTISISSAGGCFAPFDFGVAPIQGVLPIIAMPLKGTAKEKQNVLDWSTESEAGSDHFEVEHSPDGRNFVQIGTVAAKGNSILKSYYNFVHRNPASQVNYYRVKLVNKDGKINYTNIVKLAPGAKPIPMTVMPNPFNSSFTVAVNFKRSGHAIMSIVDVNGKLVRSTRHIVRAGFNSLNVNDLETLPSGTYIVHLKTDEETAFSKIIKAN